ncbi:hypothetical protein BsWGS_20041 [Bradybaena similaris]
MDVMCAPARTVLLHVAIWCGAVLDVTSRLTSERRTTYGTVRGFVDTLPGGQRVEKYLGIPYAKPPIGELRFEAPVAPDKWPGVKSVDELPPACPQARSGVDYIQFHVPEFNRTSEDCLYLNVFVPKTSRHDPWQAADDSPHKRFAVIVFVHGGSYLYGMGAMMDGTYLATHDVIVVTFNYRLGALGFLEANDDVFPGNYGLLDQVAALRWVQGNIHFFGGDPSRVTVDGHSAGGCSVGLLMLMPVAKGLFSRVIQQSGSPFADWAVTRQPRSRNFYFKLFTSENGCYGNSTAEIKACLKQMSSEKILAAIDGMTMHPVSMIPPFRPTVDGHILPDTPERLAVHGHINGRQIMTGSTTDEGLEAAFILFNTIGKDHHGLQRLLAVMSSFSVDLPDIRRLTEAVLEQYYRWPYRMEDSEIKAGFAEIVGDYFISAPTQLTAELLSARDVTVFLYNFDYFSAFDPWDGAKHGAELFYLSGYPLSGHVNFRYDQTDRSMAVLLMQTWANFARNGLPTLQSPGDFHMPPYSAAAPAYTQITAHNDQVTMSVQTAFKEDKMLFWNHHVPQLYMEQLRSDVHLINDSLNYELKHGVPTRRKLPLYINSHASGSWILIAACIGLCTLTVLLSICYCQVKRQVKTLIRQTSISSGESIL